MIVQLTSHLDNESFAQYHDELEILGPFAAPVELLVVFDSEIRLDVDLAVIREMSHRPAVFSPTSRRIVVAHSTLVFGLSRLYGLEASLATSQYLVFQELGQAADALNICTTDLEQLLETG